MNIVHSSFLNHYLLKRTIFKQNVVSVLKTYSTCHTCEGGSCSLSEEVTSDTESKKLMKVYLIFVMCCATDIQIILE